jgi:dTDP-4-amino-4,6-dideoxygalactose transaminase
LSSGTDALLLALMALDVGPGDAVITSTFSFFATAGVISRTGARPIFVDIEPESFNLDPAALRRTLEALSPAERKKARAVIAVHLYGQCANMDAIRGLAREHGLTVIEDAAQSIGAEYPSQDGVRQAGTMGEMGCYSFFPSKNLGALGDGGMIVTNDDALANVLRMKRVHGAVSGYVHEVIGGNFRLDALQAAALSVKLPHLNDWHNARRRNAAHYDSLFRERKLKPVATPKSLYEGSACKRPHIYNQYMIRVPKREELRAFLTERGIGTQVYYPVPFHRQPCFRSLGYRPEQFPAAEKAAAEVLALPIYPELTEAMQAYVVEQIAEFFG